MTIEGNILLIFLLLMIISTTAYAFWPLIQHCYHKIKNDISYRMGLIIIIIIMSIVSTLYNL